MNKRFRLAFEDAITHQRYERVTRAYIQTICNRVFEHGTVNCTLNDQDMVVYFEVNYRTSLEEGKDLKREEHTANLIFLDLFRRGFDQQYYVNAYKLFVDPWGDSCLITSRVFVRPW